MRHSYLLAGALLLAVADLNGDGRPDLLAANLSGPAVAVWLGSSTPLATAAALPGTTATLYPSTAAATLTATGLPAGARSLTATLHDALGRELRHLAVPVAAGAARAEVPTAGRAAVTTTYFCCRAGYLPGPAVYFFSFLG